MTLLRVNDLRVAYHLNSGTAYAVNGVSFALDEGKTLAIVGESGSGKSTAAHALMGVLPPAGRIVGGEVHFRGRDLVKVPESEMRKLRGKEITMVLQNPIGSFDPVYTVGAQIVEAIQAHDPMSKRAAQDRTIDLLTRVGIPDARSRFHQYPHQFSGGMSQRALIAMALVGSPKLLIADEPTSALDATVQAQIIDLLMNLCRDERLAILFITHDLGLTAFLANDVAVMYGGRVVEYGPVQRIFYQPQHPYTAALLKSIVRRGEARPHRLPAIPGAPPNPLKLPSGCKFSPRCPYVMDICRQIDPPLETDGAGQFFACHLDAETRATLGARGPVDAKE